ncbi:cytochrome c-type biogenesis protein CcmE homolog, mitochondrial-like [Coffea arabica]|uniref:Cytochrome c-type biogenesis protein CcmE homolog, mitochondrial-like n=1 Tax=Coffea arabica TaxID=13443 RepID=A0A6P6SK68_COFAR
MYSRVASHLLRRLRPAATTTTTFLRHHNYPNSFSTTTTTTFFSKSHPIFSLYPPGHYNLSPNLRFFSTRPARPVRPNRPDIGARARQLQTRRLWTYALTFSCIAGFIVIVLNQFQDQLVFYVTPTDALAKYSQNPSKSKFRLGGLVLEGSLTQIPSSPEMEFVITDLMTDILVKYEGSLPDLFREGHSVVVEGFIRPFPEKEKDEDVSREGSSSSSSIHGKAFMVSEKARSGECYFKATEVLAKHDEKYMPPEVATAIEKNKKVLIQEQQQQQESEGKGAGDGAVGTAKV